MSNENKIPIKKNQKKIRARSPGENAVSGGADHTAAGA
jgi:hypothetical protein